MFFSLFDDCRYLFIHHRYWITNESITKYIFDHLHILFSKRYRLTASDRISSLIPIQIPSRIGPVSRIHNPLVFVFLSAKYLFVCYRIVEVSHCAKHLFEHTLKCRIVQKYHTVQFQFKSVQHYSVVHSGYESINQFFNL